LETVRISNDRHDPLGGNQHHHPSHRPRRPRRSPTTSNLHDKQLIFSNTL
jgi:hypothetical protein